MTLNRSQQMSRIRGKNTLPERLLRSALWAAGLRYRLHVRIIDFYPDVVFLCKKVAVFIDGCFWHGCPVHYVRPRTRESFWANKLVENVERDRRQTLTLESNGWRVVRVWEHEVQGELGIVVNHVRSALFDQHWSPSEDIRVYRVQRINDSTEEEWVLTSLRQKTPDIVEYRYRAPKQGS